MQVKKRNGKLQEFDAEKIYNAIMGAVDDIKAEVNTDIVKRIVKDITDQIKDLDVINIEEIQDLVEDKLMNSSLKNVAKQYIKYRYNRERVRDSKSELMAKVKEKLFATNVENQNANVDERSFSGRANEAFRVIAKEYALDNCMSEMAKNNHLNNEIYIHDLDSYATGMHNCLTIPFDDILANGFKTKQCTVRPAQSVNSAMQLVAVIMQLQSLQQFGGVSASHLDWTMVPYVKKSFKKHYYDGLVYIDDFEPARDKKMMEIMLSFEPEINNEACKEYCPEAYKYALEMTEKEVYQSVESLMHNLNTLQSRSGQQLPFSSINYGTCTLPEGRMITKALLNASIAGIGKLHTTPIFPCGIFQMKTGINRKEGDPNYDLFQLALKSTSLRLYPNYANCDWSVNAGYDENDPTQYVSTMGCRTYNGYDINGLGFQKDGRGNIAPVTIIMPTLAMQARQISGDAVDNFITILDRKIHEARDMLLERYEWICSQPWESARFMYENNTMAGFDGESIESAMKHGTLVIGQLGLAETLQILIGKDHTTDEGMELAKIIEQLFKDRCAEFKQKHHLNFGVYYTPAESLCHTALEKFREQYGVLENISDKEFFTNSMHVPVWKEITPFEKIDIESQLTGYSNAGCITYVELESSASHNLEALEELVNYAMDKDIPYFAINLPNDTCNDCGFTGEFNDECPVCHSKNITQLRRVTGYLTADYKTTFNEGKVDEVERRVKHNSIIE